MKKIAYASAFLFLVPFIAAAAGPKFEIFFESISAIRSLLNAVIPVLIGVALIVFFWGLIQYIRKPEAEQGKKIMIAGLVGLFVMVSVWGIIRLMQNIAGTEDTTALPAPTVPYNSAPRPF